MVKKSLKAQSSVQYSKQELYLIFNESVYIHKWQRITGDDRYEGNTKDAE